MSVGTMASAVHIVTPTGPTLTLSAYGGGQFSSGTGNPLLTLPNWAVTSGDLLLVALGACSGNQAQSNPYFVLTGGGLTWTRMVEARRGTGTYHAITAIFRSVATSTTTITDLLADTGSDGLGIMYGMYRGTGHNVTTPIGATAVLADDSTDGQKDITLDATPAATSQILSVTFLNADDNNATKQIDHGASDGWTESFDYSPSMSAGSMWGAWMAQTKTGHTLTRVRIDDIKPASVTAVVYSFSGSAVEVKAP